jgi:TatD DNase family protein
MKVFSEQVRIAKDIGLPIVIHSRGYLDEVVKVLEQERVRGAMFHFFDGDEKQAVELAAKGHFISIPPADTGKRRRIIKEVGIRSLVVETDSPVVGRTPADVIGVCETIAKVKGITLEEAAANTTENIRRLFFI